MLINNCGKPLIICNYAFAKNNKYYTTYFLTIGILNVLNYLHQITKIEPQQPFPVLARTYNYLFSI